MQPNFTISSEAGRSFMPTESQTDGACGRVSVERHKLEIKEFAKKKKAQKYLPQGCHVYALARHGWKNDRVVGKFQFFCPLFVSQGLRHKLPKCVSAVALHKALSKSRAGITCFS